MDKKPIDIAYFGPKGTQMGDGRMNARSAVNNGEAIYDCIAGYVPSSGTVLELASGTGQHIAELASRHGKVDWQPSDVIDERMPSINAWRKHAGVDNLLAPILLDACGDWHEELADDIGLIHVANLFHVIGEQAALNVIRGVAGALAQGGYFFIYGPFRVGGKFRSDTDEAFHVGLTGKHHAVGYKDLEWMQAELENAGLSFCDLHEMPANNLVLVVQKGDGSSLSDECFSPRISPRTS